MSANYVQIVQLYISICVSMYLSMYLSVFIYIYHLSLYHLFLYQSITLQNIHDCDGFTDFHVLFSPLFFKIIN